VVVLVVAVVLAVLAVMRRPKTLLGNHRLHPYLRGKAVSVVLGLHLLLRLLPHLEHITVEAVVVERVLLKHPLAICMSHHQQSLVLPVVLVAVELVELSVLYQGRL
jgi:hypothetical protein